MPETKQAPETLEEITRKIVRRYLDNDTNDRQLEQQFLPSLRNERERCAKVADKYAADMRTVTQRTEYGEGCLQAAVYIAAAIRKGE